MERLLAFWRNRRFFKFRKFYKKNKFFSRLNTYACKYLSVYSYNRNVIVRVKNSIAYLCHVNNVQVKCFFVVEKLFPSGQKNEKLCKEEKLFHTPLKTFFSTDRTACGGSLSVYVSSFKTLSGH